MNDRLAYGQRTVMAAYLLQFDLTLRAPADSGQASFGEASSSGRARVFPNVERFNSEQMLCDHLVPVCGSNPRVHRINLLRTS